MKKTKKCSQFFLGANRPGGFSSIFEDVYKNRDGWRVYVIKGGPGSGKSTLMKAVAEKGERLGERCERIYCSSDPGSLDAVILPERRCAIFDGTAPHVLEPALPGARENIINLGECWNSDMLYAARRDIAECAAECTACHKRAQRLLACADAFRRNTSELAAAAMDSRKISAQAQRLFKKLISEPKTGGESSLRMLSAVTPQGITAFEGTLTDICSTIVPISDELYAPAAELMRQLLCLLSGKCDVINCVCSQDISRTEHIILPELSIAFSVQNPFHSLAATERAVRTERFMPKGFMESNRKRIKENRRLCKALTAEAAAEMAGAKALHDELERYYISAMDFAAVGEMAEKTLGKIFG